MIGAVLFFAKDFRRLVESQAAGKWDPFPAEMVQGRSMGIVGYGDIGRMVATHARALGMRVRALRRNLDARRARRCPMRCCRRSAWPT